MGFDPGSSSVAIALGYTYVTPSGDGTGVKDWTNIQSAMLAFGTLQSWGEGSGGIVYLDGFYNINKPLIVPSNVLLLGSGPFATIIQLVTGSNCDIIQWSTNSSSAQATLLSGLVPGLVAGNIVNAFYSGLENIALHGDSFSTTVAGYHHGINITTNPLNSAAGSDPDFDPMPTIRDVIIKACTGDGFYHAGRSGGCIERVTSEYNTGNGFSPSYDTSMVDCLANANGICGFYMNHGSDTGTACKSFLNGGQNSWAAQWISGHSYTPGNTVINSGVLYFCILAVSGSTAPGSDPTHWTALTATSPAAWGDGYYWDSNSGEQAWAAVDAQNNTANSYHLHSCGTVNLQCTSLAPNQLGTGSNPNGYAAIFFDGCHYCNVTVTAAEMSNQAYVYNFTGGDYTNQIVATSDGTEQGFNPNANHFGLLALWNGQIYPVVAIPTSFFSSTIEYQQLESALSGNGRIYQGSGAPSSPGVTNPNAGDIYFRIDTPSTANQRIYICTTGGATPVWSGIV